MCPPVSGSLQFPGQWRGRGGHPWVQPGAEQGVVARVGVLGCLYGLAAGLITFRQGKSSRPGSERDHLLGK